MSSEINYIERLTNRMNKTWERLNYKDDEGMLFYKTIFQTWVKGLSDSEKKVMYNSENIDFFDFVSGSSYVINMIDRGKKTFDPQNVKPVPGQPYKMVDGVAIQEHNPELGKLTLDLIGFIFSCYAGDTELGQLWITTHQ